MTRVQLHTGPARSTREARINEICHDNSGHAILLVPTALAALHRREKLARSGKNGLWGHSVFEFTDFAATLLVTEGYRVHRIGDFERKLMLESCLATIEDISDFPLRTEEGLFAAGTLRHLLRVITQIKQAGIEPHEYLERTAKQSATVDQLVAAAYTAYQDKLKVANAYDVPGIYWAAEAYCREHRPSILDGVSTLLLDGFDDFTPSQFRFIEALAPHVANLVYGITHDDLPAHRDLYRITQNAVEQIQNTHDITAESHLSFEAQTTHDHAIKAFLSRDRITLPEGLSETLHFSACLDTTHEIESIGRKIKKLILCGEAHPTEIAVVYRSLSDSASEIERCFSEFGIPLAIHHAPSLSQSPLGAFLPRLIRALTSWQREEILDILSSPWLEAGPYSSAFPLIARRAGIIEDQSQWEKRLTVLAQRIETSQARDIKRLKKELTNPGEVVQAMLNAVTRLSELEELFPESGLSEEYVYAMRSLITKLDRNVVKSPGHDEIHKLLTIIERAEKSEEPLPRAVWLRRFEQGLNESTYRLPRQRYGVKILEASSVRNLRFKHVFFAGLNEGILPAPPPGNVLFAGNDIDRLRSAGISIEGRREHGDRERLLFHHVLEAASEELHLSWRLTNENENEASRSPFLIELLEHFPSANIVRATEDSFLPSLDKASSLRDLRNALRRHAPGLCRNEDASNILGPSRHGAQIESQRQAHTPFNEYDGVLEDTIAIRLSKDFGPNHIFSVSQLEGYAECPFRFFVQRVLHAEETEIPSDSLDPRVRGMLLHETLRLFHSEHQGKHPVELSDAEVRTSLTSSLDTTFKNFSFVLAPLAPALVTAEKTRMAEVLDRYIRQQQDSDDPGWKPTYFEVAFGHAQEDEEVDSESNPNPFQFETSKGPIHVAGRIDRVDKKDDALRLVDYKSGRTPSSGDITSGRNLQLSLYALAVGNHLFPGSQCEEAIYLPVGRDRVQTSLTGEGRNWPKREENMRMQIDKSVSGTRTGKFPPNPTNEACAYCAFKDTCRYEKSRTQAKLDASL